MDTVASFSYWRLFIYADWKDNLLMAIGSLSAIAAGSAPPLMTIIMGDFTNTFAKYQYKEITKTVFEDNIKDLSLKFVYLAIATFVTTYFFVASFTISGERISHRIRKQFFSSLLKQDIPWWDSKGIGEFSVRLESDTIQIQDGLAEKLGDTIQSIATFVTGFVIAFTKSAEMAGPLLSCVPLILGSTIAISFYNSKYVKKGLDAYGSAAVVAEESLSSIRTVKAFGAESRLAKKYSSNLLEARKMGEKRGIGQGIMLGVIFLIIYCTYALAFWYGSTLITQGKVDVGIILTVFFSIIIGSFALGNVGPNVQAFQLAKGAGRKLFEVLERPLPLDPSLDNVGIIPATLKGNIEYCNVSFSYPSRQQVKVLDDFSIKIPQGKVYALVGQSGSGKSTIVQLLERFYNPDKGHILLDDQPIENYNIRWFRNQIGLVSQEPILFNLTIAENVKFGLSKESLQSMTEPQVMERIINACKLANAHDFISKLPKGYDTRVGERGFLISGGQKQRICIARSIIKDPKILLLDEATSALDTRSESIVQAALDKACSGRTTIVIAHRLSTIKNADKIIVMEKGRIIELGSHQELMVAKQGKSIYREYALLQQMNQVEEELRNSNENIEKRDQEALMIKASIGSINEAKNPDENDENDDVYKGPVVKEIAKLNSPELFISLFGFAGAFMAGSVTPAYAIIFSNILNDLSIKDDSVRQGKANFWSCMFIILAVGSFISYFLQYAFFSVSSERLIERIRSQSFTAMLDQEVGWFDRDCNGTGALMARLSSDATMLSGVTGQTLGAFLQISITIIGGLLVAFIVGWELTLVCLVVIPLSISSGYIRTVMTKKASIKLKVAYEESSKVAIEAISAMRTVYSLVIDNEMRRRYDSALEQPEKIMLQSAVRSSLFFAFAQSINFLSNALAFWYGARLFMRDTNPYDLQKMFTVFMTIVFGTQSAGRIFALAPDATKAMEAAKSILSVLKRVPRVMDRPDATKLETLEYGSIEFKDVEFSYPTRPDARVLKGVSFIVEAGKKVALVGPSGCGKSTLISLIERFYDVQKGEILIDGKPIQSYTIKSLRSKLSLVGQEPTLFSGTCATNVSFGLEDTQKTAQSIKDACEKANAATFISNLPSGFDTDLGSKGGQLSGGQKQRLAIARAIIRNPKILLLDEATSALDAESEKVVQNALDAASNGRTTIAIAHRLSTIQHFDLIIVFEDGRIVEQGNHKSLIEKRGMYYSLAKRQNLTE